MVGRIIRKGTIRTSKLDFEIGYYVARVQNFTFVFMYHKFVIKKNKVLFKDTDCLVLSEEFQLPDASQRMAHVNFKTINKLAKEGLVDGLPLKVFTNEHNCVACNKGKQHKASYKHISAVRFITDTLQLLHMDLFGPTNIRSIDQKYYSLVVKMTSAGTTELNINEGPSSSNGPSIMERNADYAEELAKLQRQEYEAKDAAARYGYLFSQATAEILCQAEAEIRNQGVSAVQDPAGVDSAVKDSAGVDSAVRVPSGIVSADGVSTGSPSADSDPAGGNPADSFPPAGSVEPADESNPAVSSSVSADLNSVYADESTLPPGQQLGTSENTTRFPVPSDVCMDQLSSGIFTSSSEIELARIEDIRCLAFAPIWAFWVFQWTFKSAFLYGEIEEEVFVHSAKVSACSRHQVTPLTSHLNAVKKIFKYLKGQPKLGLWYPKDSPFQLEAYSDSDYAGSHGDRKSTTGGCQFLGRRLISWQCKKQTIVATSSTEAEYVAAASCCAQVLWIQNQLLDYGFNFMNTKIFIDNQSTICIVKNPVFHQRTKHIEIRHHFIRDANEKNLIQVLKIHTDDNVADLLTKAFDGPRFAYLVVHIGMVVNTAAGSYPSCCKFVILPAGRMVSAGWSMVLLVVILPAGRMVSAGWSMVLLVVILPAGRMVSAGWSMVLLVVILPAGRMVSAGWSMVLLVIILPAGRLVSAVGLWFCVNYSSDGRWFLLKYHLIVEQYLLLLVDFLPAGLKYMQVA
ncbi:hypothetical protein Tco_0096868 [Tanacetum coccineum]